MERFIFEVIEPLIAKDLDEERRKARIDKVAQELRAFIKGELVPINKELSKKTRQLFVAASDIETLKESVETFEREAMKLRGEVAMKDNDIVKQRMMYERDAQQLKEEIENLKKEMKKSMIKFQSDLERLNQQWTDKTNDLKRQHKNQMTTALDKEIKHWEQALETQKQTASQQKNHIIQETSKEKSKLIKKYQEKIYNLKNESEDTLEKTLKEWTAKFEDLKSVKNDVFNKLTIEEANSRRLTLDLEKQIGQHNMFRSQFQSTFRQLEGNRRRNEEERQRLINECEGAKTRMKDLQRDLTQTIKQLQNALKNTIQDKDKKFTDTIEIMSTQHRIEVESLQNNMIEQRQIAITNVEVKAYEEMFQQLRKYQKLELQHRDLEDKYTNVKEFYEQKLKKIQEEHQDEIANMLERKDYEFQLSGENSKREYNNLMNKFTLEIRSLKAQQALEMENAQKKAQEQKIALSNKLISQYEGMLSDQRNNTEIQIKQKMMQFDRKSKAYDKRIAESEKRKSELKVAIERMKLESQMKIESMMEVNEKLEEEIESLHERILELEKVKSGLINDYEFQLLLLKNEIEKVKEDCREKEDELRANLNEKIVVKNKEIAKFAERIKQQTEQLIRRHKDRTNALEKEYQELKRVINQKTSLPEDIEALKVFHAAYIEKEQELISERRKREELQRQLHSKDAIEKVFATKEAFKRFTVIEKMGQTSKNMLGKFTSAQM